MVQELKIPTRYWMWGTCFNFTVVWNENEELETQIYNEIIIISVKSDKSDKSEERIFIYATNELINKKVLCF